MKKKSQEPKWVRLERLALSKAQKTQVIKNKKKEQNKNQSRNKK